MPDPGPEEMKEERPICSVCGEVIGMEYHEHQPTPAEVEAAAKAIAEYDGWDWHPDDYRSPDPKWQPTDKEDYRTEARAALDAAARVAQ